MIAVSDSLAQLVEHNTFNVGVMGSSPMRVTKRRTISSPLFLLITHFRLSEVRSISIQDTAHPINQRIIQDNDEMRGRGGQFWGLHQLPPRFPSNITMLLLTPNRRPDTT